MNMYDAFGSLFLYISMNNPSPISYFLYMFYRYCGKHSSRRYHNKLHESSCIKMNRVCLTPGFFRYKQTIFEEMESFGIVVPTSLRCKKHFCFFDVEAILESVNIVHGEKVTLTHRHRVISAAYASSVPGMTEAQGVVNEDPKQILHQMFIFFHNARFAAIREEMITFLPYIKKLQRKLNVERKKAVIRWNQRQQESDEIKEVSEEQAAKEITRDPLVKQYADLLERLYDYISCLPVFTFNGSR